MSIKRDLLEKVISGDNKGDFFISHRLYKDIETFLDQPEQQPEHQPEAWIIVNKETGYRTQVSDLTPFLYHREIFEVIPLYTAPPKREPLTRVEIDTIWVNNYDIGFLRLVRLIEKAHGIGGGE